jgi:CheY-like chemotaxis protein
MAAEVVERATEPFFTTKKEGRGTGLGLAMASGFVQQSRGRLEIESRVDNGTLIRLLFPISHLQEAEEKSGRSVTAVLPTSAGDTGAEHILVVEDSAEVLELATEILTSAGYRVSTAESGELALRMFEQAGPGTFDLVFTDLVMPGGINGLILADEVLERDPQIAVLMTTGYNEELVVSGPKRNAKDVLGKPYRRSELLDRIRQALNNKSNAKERRTPSDYGAAEA